jgi:glyoxylase-like metal-dependent hydrolase (beta-lactamase superfamily II)
MQHIRGNSYFFNSPAAIGGYLFEQNLILFDTGNDDSSVKKAIRDLGEIRVQAIFNTHSHADHCGGNAYIQRHHSAITYAPYLESAFIENPLLEPIYLYGANPVTELQNKFLMAKPSLVHTRLDDDSPITIQLSGKDVTIQPVSLKGHSPNQMGYVTEDGVAFLGDALISISMIEKHPLIFTFDVTSHLESLNKLFDLQADTFIIAHGGIVEDKALTIQKNIDALELTQTLILESVGKGANTIDEVHRYLSNYYQLNENLGQHLLNRSVIKAHLTHLVYKGIFAFSLENGILQINQI